MFESNSGYSFQQFVSGNLTRYCQSPHFCLTKNHLTWGKPAPRTPPLVYIIWLAGCQPSYVSGGVWPHDPSTWTNYSPVCWRLKVNMLLFRVCNSGWYIHSSRNLNTGNQSMIAKSSAAEILYFFPAHVKLRSSIRNKVWCALKSVKSTHRMPESSSLVVITWALSKPILATWGVAAWSCASLPAIINPQGGEWHCWCSPAKTSDCLA